MVPALSYALVSAVALGLCLAGVEALRASRRPRLVGLLLIALWVGLIVARLRSVALVDIGVLLCAVGGAAVIAALLRDNAAVVSFVAAAALMDLYSYFRGPTRALLDTTSEGIRDLLRYLAVAIPADAGLTLVVGLGDLFIASAAFAALSRLGHPRARTGALLVVALMTAVGLGTRLGGMPAVPFLAIAVLVEQLLVRRA